jgi:segregation and condensation protein B
MMGLTSLEPELNLSAYLEALLFVAPGPVTALQLAAALDVPSAEIERELDAMAEQYVREGSGRGIRLVRHRGRFQLTSAPQAAAAIERFLGLEASGRLSSAAMEALAIVMYKQPVTRPQIDAIRGVNSDGVLKSLLNKGLIQEVGRAESPGRPILYAITFDFLQYFGLNSLAELPPLDLDQFEENHQESVQEALET